MAQASNVSLAPGDLRRHARERWRQDRPRDALDLAWAAFDLAPDERATKLLLVNLLQHYPAMLDAHRQEAYLGCRSICHRLPLLHATMLCFPMILSIAILNHGPASS
jgi:hypothetical protein